MTGLFTNHVEACFWTPPGERCTPGRQANFKHTMFTVARDLQGLLLRQFDLLSETVHRILDCCVGKCRQRCRPGASILDAHAS